MNPKVITVGLKTPLREVLQLMLRYHLNNTVVVDSADWAAALRLIEAAGLRATLTGTTLRVPTATAAAVQRALAAVPGDAAVPGNGAESVPARVHEEAATLEERFFELAAVPS